MRPGNSDSEGPRSMRPGNPDSERPRSMRPRSMRPGSTRPGSTSIHPHSSLPPGSSIPPSHFAGGEPEPGSPPGTLRIADGDPPEIHVIDYTASDVHEHRLCSVDDVAGFLRVDNPRTTWIDVRGIRDRVSFERLGEIFKIHPLALEDVVNAPQRPHTDTYPEQQVVITRMVEMVDGRVSTEQLALLIGRGYVVTVQEEPEHDCLDVVRGRLRSGRGAIREAGAEYLAYALIDAVIDGFYPVLESIGEQLEALEADITSADRSLPQQVHQLKRDLLIIRRAIWPQRDLLNALLRDESAFFTAKVRPYLRDTYDHAVQVMDMVETYREIASGLMDLYLSGVSNRMNEIMKVLTIISTVFLPMTFIAGVYGMNFDPDASPYNMPELRWRYGYPGALLLMVASLVVLFLYYRRKGWIGRG
jgi:magnesium transporter